ncbi:hypothetical protein SBD_7562 [Streptomyces bottropensis ATCC 25435]|uniref:Uncharacterized protein n=1 Tax=Streptomyces bottropensis ATCC 25435 TaxID=1054862 RepID=M3FFS2_9ACTN|nr:hypothetical protein SBD_7562 [Streptomyces bottropensis ATCC 25435]
MPPRPPRLRGLPLVDTPSLTHAPTFRCPRLPLVPQREPPP